MDRDSRRKDSDVTTGSFVTAPLHCASASKYICPSCHANLVRTWRRPVDRFTSQFVPVHRYRCQSFACQWEGNFRVQRDVLAVSRRDARTADAAGMVVRDDDRLQAVPKSFVVHMALAVAGMLFVVVFAHTDWRFSLEFASANPEDAQWPESVSLMEVRNQVGNTPAAAPRTAHATTVK